MLPRLLGEPDLLLGVVQYLPLRSIARLLRTSRNINHFVKENECRIRSSINIAFRFDIFGSEEAIGINVGAGKAFKIKINRLDWQIERNADCEIIDGIFLTKKSDRVQVLIRHLDVAQALSWLWIYFLRGFRIQTLEVSLEEYWLWYAENLYDWLSGQGVSLDKMAFHGHYPREEKLVAMLEPFDVRQLDLSGRNRKQSESEYNALSSSFFLRLPTVRELVAPKTDCQVADDDLKRFDVLEISGSNSHITFDGLFDWTKQKELEGPVGARFYCSQRLDIATELGNRLVREYFKDQDHYFRGRSGRWVYFRNSDDNTAIRICPSYADCFLANDGKEAFDMDMSAELGPDSHSFYLSSIEYGDKLFFSIVNHRPASDGAVVVDRLSETASVYEIGFQKFKIYAAVELDNFDLNTLSETLKTFGSRLNGAEFHGASCFGTLSLPFLMTVREAWPSDYAIEELDLRTVEELTPSIIQSLHIKKLSSPPISLTADFFSQTPTLTRLHFPSYYSEECTLEITNEILQRFHVFLAETAETLIDVTGLRDWIAARLAEETDNDEEPLVRTTPLQCALLDTSSGNWLVTDCATERRYLCAEFIGPTTPRPPLTTRSTIPAGILCNDDETEFLALRNKKCYKVIDSKTKSEFS